MPYGRPIPVPTPIAAAALARELAAVRTVPSLDAHGPLARDIRACRPLDFAEARAFLDLVHAAGMRLVRADQVAMPEHEP